MAAPIPVATQTSAGTATTTAAVVLPTSTYTAGDSVLVALTTNDNTHTAPTGLWYQLKTYVDTGLSRTSFYRLTATGSESGTTVNFTIGGTSPFTAVALHVTGAEAEVGVASTGADGAGTTIQADEVEAEWSGSDNLFVVVAGWVDDDAALTAHSALYLTTQDDLVSGGGTNAGCGTAVATRRLKADADTPGPITIDSSEAWVAFTVVIPATFRAAPAEPTGPTGLAAQVFIDGQWTDIGEDGVYTRDPVSIRHGRSDWAAEAEPSSCRLTLDNRTGKWSPDYTGAGYYGSYKRNIPIRVGKAGHTGVETATDVVGPLITLPHAAADLLAGDLDLRVEFQFDGPPGGAYSQGLASKMNAPDGWALILLGSSDQVMTVQFYYYDTGGTARSSISAAMPREAWWRRTAVRVTLDESTGVVTFYRSTSIDGTWTEVSTSNPAGGASQLDHTAAVPTKLGDDDFPSTLLFTGRIYAYQLLDGIGGTLVADLDLRAVTPGSSSVVDDTARTWTVQSDGVLTATDWRFYGELASLPVEWSLSGNDQWSQVEAAGLLRRLKQWDDALDSPLRRGLVRGTYSSDIVNYWPMEDKGDATMRRIGAAIGSQLWVKKGTGEANPAANSDFVASDAIMEVDTDTWHTQVDPMAETGEWMVRFLLSVPDDHSTLVELLHIVTGDVEYRFFIGSTGALQMRGYRNGVLTHTGSSWAFGAVGTPFRISLTVEQNGANVDVGILGLEPGSTSTAGGSDSFANVDASRPTFIRLNQAAAAGGIGIGHFTVESVVRTSGFEEELAGYDGEEAVTRMVRLAEEEGIQLLVYGDLDDSVKMGPQSIASFLDLLQECAKSDLGALFDRPDGPGLGYRPGASMRAQEAGLTVDYDAAEILGTPTLQRDDQDFANDVTVKNWDGSSARAELTTGEYSTAEPPTGAGRYRESFEINVADGESLVGHAWARLQLYSVDQPRVTSLMLATHLPTLTVAQVGQILGLLPGDKVALTDLPATVHPEDLPQLVQGWTEEIGTHTHTMRVNTTPAAPWDPGVVEQDGDIRYDTAGSILATGAEAGATTLYVHTTGDDEELWTTDSNDLPFDILVGGARVTVTAISGSSSPQTFTTSATPRDLSGGADVRLADPAYYSL